MESMRKVIKVNMGIQKKIELKQRRDGVFSIAEYTVQIKMMKDERVCVVKETPSTIFIQSPET